MMFRRNLFLLVILFFANTTTAIAQPRGLDLSPIQWPLYALRAYRELGLTKEEAQACERELTDYKREEKMACHQAWEEVKNFPKTEIKLTLHQWFQKRKQTRSEQLELIRDRIQPELRDRYNEILFQCCLYHGDFFLADEVAGLELPDETIERLTKRRRSQSYGRTGEFDVERYRHMVEVEMLERELGRRVDLGAPSRAALEFRDGAGIVYAAMMYPYHVEYGQLRHGKVAQELALSQDQIGRLRAIGEKHGIRERKPNDPEQLYPVSGGYNEPNVDPEVDVAKSKRIIKELNAVLTEGQQIRWHQIKAQAEIAASRRDQALKLLGGDQKRDLDRDVRIDRVKNVLSTDFTLVKARELLGTAVSSEQIDRAMGSPSFEFLDFQSRGFGGASNGKQNNEIVPRKGRAFEKLAELAGPWYANAIREMK